MLMRIVPAIVAGGVIVAGVVLWRLCQFRRGLHRARWIVAALSAYGTATLVYAAVAGISLREAVRGGLMHSVPFVLQGAFIGAFVVLPLGWVAAVLRSGFPRFRSRAPVSAVSQAIALTTC